MKVFFGQAVTEAQCSRSVMWLFIIPTKASLLVLIKDLLFIWPCLLPHICEADSDVVQLNEPAFIPAGCSAPALTPVLVQVPSHPTQSSLGWVHVPSPWGSEAGHLVGAPWWQHWSWGESRPSHGLPPPGPGPRRTSRSDLYRRAEQEPWHSPDPPERRMTKWCKAAAKNTMGCGLFKPPTDRKNHQHDSDVCEDRTTSQCIFI